MYIYICIHMYIIYMYVKEDDEYRERERENRESRRQHKAMPQAIFLAHLRVLLYTLNYTLFLVFAFAITSNIFTRYICTQAVNLLYPDLFYIPSILRLKYIQYIKLNVNAYEFINFLKYSRYLFFFSLIILYNNFII